MANPSALPVSNFPSKSVSIRPVYNNGFPLYDLGLIQSAYALDLPTTIYMAENNVVQGRIMGIYREGGLGMHVVKMMRASDGGIKEICVRCAVSNWN